MKRWDLKRSGHQFDLTQFMRWSENSTVIPPTERKSIEGCIILFFADVKLPVVVCVNPKFK